MKKNLTTILTIIVLSQFMCTSLWFAGNAVMPNLVELLGLRTRDLGHITSSVQFGFITGTLFFAIFTIADRFKPSHVFFVSALLGASFNALVILEGLSFIQILILRFLTGFFLAGIYPVGMKIASDYYEKGLGRALSFLVGALVIGTAFPHLVSDISDQFSWKIVMLTTSGLALLGGLMMVVFVEPGPFRKPGQKQQFGAILKVFKNKQFRAASFGYFGHMWELYAFWAFVPLMIGQYSMNHSVDLNAPLLSFLIIGLGGIACLFGGLLSERFGEKKIAGLALTTSGICCLLSPLLFAASPFLFIGFLILWGWAVIVDSPLFSSLVAKHADPEIRGTSLTLVNCIGFTITIVSIQLLSIIVESIPFEYLFLILALGPTFGVISLYRKRSS